MITVHLSCGKTWTGNRRSHCPVCHETFNSDSVADRHRVRDHNDGTRRCLTPAELNALGLAVNGQGYWADSRFDSRDYSHRPDVPLSGQGPAPDAPEMAA